MFNFAQASDTNELQSPDSIKARRALAKLLLERGTDTSPVQHWSQGAARLVDAFNGTMEERRADRADKAGMKAASDGLAAIAGGGQTPAPVSPPALPTLAASPGAGNGFIAGIDDRYTPDEAKKELALWADRNKVDLSGLDGTFAVRKAAFLEDNPYEGGISITSAYRSPEKQAAMYANRANNPYPVAPPGKSRHNFGQAGDISSDTPEGMAWAHANASKYGLAFPHKNDPIHVELAKGATAKPVQVASAGNSGDFLAARQQQADQQQGAATPVQQVAQALPAPAPNPNSGRAAKIMQFMSSPAYRFASPGQQDVVKALLANATKDESPSYGFTTVGNQVYRTNPKTGSMEPIMTVPKDPLDVEGKQLDIQKKRQDLKDKPNVELVRDAATGEIIAVDKNNVDGGVKVLRQAGPSKEAPITRQLKQPDGSEVAVQWNPQTRDWDPMKAPQGGAAIKAPGKMTEQQSKDLVYYNRGVQALADFGDGAALTEITGATIGQAPLVGNFAKSAGYQKAEQAGQNFLNSILRKDSGAAITKAESDNYGAVFLPRPGDSPATLAQKAEARRQAIDAIRDGLGPVDVLALARRTVSRDDASAGVDRKLSPPAQPSEWRDMGNGVRIREKR